MKQYRWIMIVLSLIIIFSATDCSEQQNPVIVSELLPETIKSVKMSGFHNGELEPWDLNSTEIEDLKVWIGQLSLEHKTYKENEVPNEKWAGGISYSFNINDGELSFTYLSIDTAYI